MYLKINSKIPTYTYFLLPQVAGLYPRPTRNNIRQNFVFRILRLKTLRFESYAFFFFSFFLTLIYKIFLDTLFQLSPRPQFWFGYPRVQPLWMKTP